VPERNLIFHIQYCYSRSQSLKSA